jgi:hypothetical protein
MSWGRGRSSPTGSCGGACPGGKSQGFRLLFEKVPNHPGEQAFPSGESLLSSHLGTAEFGREAIWGYNGGILHVTWIPHAQLASQPLRYLVG